MLAVAIGAIKVIVQHRRGSSGVGVTISSSSSSSRRRQEVAGPFVTVRLDEDASRSLQLSMDRRLPNIPPTKRLIVRPCYY